MASIVRIGKDGKVVLPREVLDSLRLGAPYEVEVEGSVVRLSPAAEEEHPLWETQSPEEWVKSFLSWMNEPKPSVPHLSDEAFRRENLYD